MFDIEELKQRAGHQRFLQGKKLAEQGCVSRLALDGDAVTGTVSGSEDYHVSLTKGSKIDNYCSCPAATYQDVCKHCVALAIAFATYDEPLVDINTQTQILREYLLAMSHDTLVDQLMETITNDAQKWDKWQLKLTIGQSHEHNHNGASLETLIKLLIHALPEEQVWDWKEVRDYFERANEQFEVIFEASESLAFDEQWLFCMAAIERLNLVLEQIDDSNGERFAIEGELNEKLGRLFERLSWPDDKKAQWLLDNLTDARFDVFPVVPDDFSFSAEVQALFLAKCDKQVQSQAAKVDHADFEQSYRFSRLVEPLVRQAQQANDWQEHCRLLALTARNHSDYLGISQICLDQGEALNAEHWLRQAQKQCSSKYEQRECAKHEVTVCLALGERTIAWNKAWQLFCQSPKFTDYLSLEKLHQELGEPDAHFLPAVEQVLLEAYQTESKLSWFANDELLTFYLHQQQLDKAREWVKNHQASGTNLIQLAKLIVGIHPKESIALYYKVLKTVIEQTNNSAYQQAMDLLLQLKSLIAGGAEPEVAEQVLNVMVTELVREFKAKRNMMKLLKKHFSQCF